MRGTSLRSVRGLCSRWAACATGSVLRRADGVAGAFKLAAPALRPRHAASGLGRPGWGLLSGLPRGASDTCLHAESVNTEAQGSLPRSRAHLFCAHGSAPFTPPDIPEATGFASRPPHPAERCAPPPSHHSGLARPPTEAVPRVRASPLPTVPAWSLAGGAPEGGRRRAAGVLFREGEAWP